jgi:ankyrin repeat protein
MNLNQERLLFEAMKIAVFNNNLENFKKIYSKSCLKDKEYKNVAIDDNGYTLLMFVVNEDNYEISKYLLDNRHSPYTKNNTNQDCFDIAGNEDIKQLLMNYKEELKEKLVRGK